MEEIARLAKVSQNPEDLKKAIQSAREAIKGVGAPLQELDKELSTWQSKLDVIWKEPVAREGMGKHAEYWVEKLKNV